LLSGFSGFFVAAAMDLACVRADLPVTNIITENRTLEGVMRWYDGSEALLKTLNNQVFA
jgi:hypothetical protein